MNKTHINLSIDQELLIEAKKRISNMSRTFETFLRSYLEIPESEIPDMKVALDVEIDKAKIALAKLEEKKNYIEKKEQKEKDDMFEVSPGVFVPKSVYGRR